MNQPADIEWRDGKVPVSTRFDDPYYSLDNGLAETQHVFLAGNDLPTRFTGDFHIAELGFGTGLNLLTTMLHWPGNGQLTFTSFEAFPLQKAEAEKALAHFQAVQGPAQKLLDVWDQIGAGPVPLTDTVTLNVIKGDARDTVARWSGQADAWFLDGFSPAKNPELWGADLMSEIAKHTASGGTVATYTAAGHVRRALETAGFDVVRVPGFGRKRHMTTAQLK
ncbi:tRNA (5-methylaminomethyl-2-thiouridine)(34)-methyltransferase MnmD [Aestuariibius sp. HNIBRBA575]|uniref:tRNA (5-methylaminomethyl-2-thiouridine)(34)-methyltransferase MnmD n=1 Tax=Aestuariibius sp. HNIBRBA575 TaxID=3233343 RepID=UPI0034A3DB37